MISPDLNSDVPTELGSVHFVGIGGSGMSGIARLFMERGHRVSGSDRSENHNTEDLRHRGATITIGHDAANLGDAEALVYTSALWPDNPEYLLAIERHIPVLHRSQALAWLIDGRRLISVAGAHGKTTSVGMLVTALIELGADPSFVNGGVIESMKVSAASGEGELFVVEADESDGSFLLYDTAIALITNVDDDHLDHYGTSEAFDAAFVTFAASAREFVAISSDDAGARRIAASLSGQKVVTFGEDAAADVRVGSIDTSGPVTFTIDWHGSTFVGNLAVPGRHNAINAAGAFSVLVELGFEPQTALNAIALFRGTERRFELHGTIRGVSVYDDYAHHPAEVAAALEMARTVVGKGKIIAVHQPHLYSRTQKMAGQFAEVYERLADHTIVVDVYGAREDPVEGVTGALVSERFHDASKVAFLPNWQEAADRAAAIACDGDIIMTLSCGNINLIVPQLLASLDAIPES